jgi:hypothetical protein
MIGNEIDQNLTQVRFWQIRFGINKTLTLRFHG